MSTITFNFNMSYINVSSVRMARFLYYLGFDKESYYTDSGKEKWRFPDCDEVRRSIAFYKEIRALNRSSTYGELQMDKMD